tara:strand:+ start:331 stop:1194 length:864 start_codon:yes stop_codon:yes gene_type:complete
MNNIDLNIDNYELKDLLELFNLQYDFNEDDLKKTKKMVLKTHPDKSKLEKEYFLFFTAAFKIIVSIYEFRTRSNKQTSTEYLGFEEDPEKKLLMKNLSKKKNFNKIFNELFEKHKVTDNYFDNGYGEWLKSNEDIDNRQTSWNEMNSTFEKKKEEVKALIVKTDIEEYNLSNNYQIGGDKPEYYSSDLFSSLQYEDLQRAHKESVIPVTNKDWHEVKQYKNVNELEKSRNEKINPLSFEQATNYLNNKNNLVLENDTRRAFNLAKECEEAKKANTNFFGRFKQLTNT